MTPIYHVFDPHWRQYLSVAAPKGWADSRDQADTYATARDAYAALTAAEHAWPFRSDLYVVKRSGVVETCVVERRDKGNVS